MIETGETSVPFVIETGETSGDKLRADATVLEDGLPSIDEEHDAAGAADDCKKRDATIAERETIILNQENIF